MSAVLNTPLYRELVEFRAPAKSSPGPLTITDRGERQFNIESDHRNRPGNWEDIYVEFSGFFGSYGPQVFAVAPELLAFAKDIHNSAISLPPEVRAQLHALIAKAGGFAS